MDFLSELIISLLKHAEDDLVSLELVKKDLRLPSLYVLGLLGKLQCEGLAYLHNGFIKINASQRLAMAIRALQLGADCERVSGFLEWKEFESVAAAAFKTHGYAVQRNLRFNQGGRKWEMDVVGCKKPLVVCVDCKHWRRGYLPSKLKRAIDEQAKRTLAFSKSQLSLTFGVDCASWSNARFVPVVVSLAPTKVKFCEGTPIVAILQLQDFLAQLPMLVNDLRFFDEAQTHFRTAS
jgi:Holliday junction resolvase-like predicted endonuclease